MEDLLLGKNTMGLLFIGMSIIVTILFLCLSSKDYRKKRPSDRTDVLIAGNKIKSQGRREALRVEIKWPVTIETSEGSISGEIVNVSIDGAFICCQKLPRLKETFRLNISPPDHQAVRVNAEVVWSNFSVPEGEVVNRGMGVRFIEVSNEDRQFIARTIADHNQKHHDRREALRVEAKWPVTIETAEGSFNGEIMNISIGGGAFICCQKLSHLKGAFRLTINPPDHQALTVTAEVLWSNFSMPDSEIVNRGMGVRFVKISNEDRQFISEAMAVPS